MTPKPATWNPTTLLLAGPPVLFLIAFYFYPLASIFWVSFTAQGPWGPLDPGRLFSGFQARVLWFTCWQAGLSTLLTLGLALPGAYVLARYRFPGQDLIWSLSTVPFILPTVVVATAFQAWLGERGLVNGWLAAAGWPGFRLEDTVWFFLLAHVFYNYTVVLRLVGGAWSQLSPTLTEAARCLGASPWISFRRVTLPLLLPSVLAAALLVFIFCFTSFGIILILGGPGLTTLEVEIYQQAVHYFNLPLSAALSLLQIMFTLLLMWAYTWTSRRIARPLNPEARAKTQRPPGTWRAKLLVGGQVLFMLLLLGAPLLALVHASVSTETGFSLEYYRALFDQEAQALFFISPGAAIVNSIGFALGTMFLAVGLGLPAAAFLARPASRLATVLDPIFMLPLATSAVTLGFGFILALDRPPLDLRTSVALTPLAHTLVAFPFVVRSLLPSLRSLPRNLKESAAVLGASPWQVWRRVDLPIVGRAVLVGAVFALAVSLGEFGATSFVARPETATMPLAIYRFLSQPGELNHGRALAMSCLLMVVTAFLFLILEKTRNGQREF